MKYLAALLLLTSLGAWGQTVNSSSDSRSAAASVATQGNAQNITFNGATPLESTTIRAVPTIMAPSVGMTANCMIGTSGGVAGLGFGIAAGGGIEDKECTLRETARLLAGLGQKDAALRLMCTNQGVAKALGELCNPPMPPAPRVITCYDDPVYAAKINAQVCK